MQVYITDLAAYNQGFLIGEWASLPMYEDELKSKITKILSLGAKACGDDEHEEMFITDSEDFPLQVNEYDNVYKLNEIAEKMENLDDNEKKIVEFLLGDNIVHDIDEAIENIENVIVYESMTMEDIAEDFIENSVDMSNIPSILINAIDYEKIGNDLYIDGNYYKVDGDIYEVNI